MIPILRDFKSILDLDLSGQHMPGERITDPLSCKAPFMITLLMHFVLIYLSKHVYHALDVHNMFSKLEFGSC